MPNVEEIVETSKDCFDNFPQRYRSAQWDNDIESEIDIVWRNAEKVRFSRYFNMDERYPEYHMNLPAGADDVMKWSGTQIPVNLRIQDGINSYSRSNPRPSSRSKREPTIRIQKSRGLFSTDQPHREFWPHARIRADFKLIDDPPEEMSGYIGLRTEPVSQLGVSRSDFYIDPEHDYICVRHLYWRLKADTNSWEKEFEHQYSDFTQLPQGQWYPQRILTIFSDPEKGRIVRRGGGRTSINKNIDIQLLNEDEFPPDTFNGEKLLEDAKVETF